MPGRAGPTVASVVAVTGVLLNQVMIWPQVVRAFRTVEGVAALTVLTGLLARALWSVYGAVLDDPALVWGNVTVATGFLAVLVLLAVRRRAPLLLGGAAAVGLAVVGVALAGETVLGWVAVVTAAVVNLPQTARVLTDRHRLAGVSVPTYGLVAAASACWLTYGLVTSRPLISAPHLLLFPSAVLIAVVALRSQRRARRTTGLLGSTDEGYGAAR